MTHQSKRQKYLCTRKFHYWETQEEAERCCNGWIRLMVPLQYGEDEFFGAPVKNPYYISGLWKPWLIREEETEEIERLLTLMPMTLRSSTSANPWITTPQ
jgi:hypothetical protein